MTTTTTSDQSKVPPDEEEPPSPNCIFCFKENNSTKLMSRSSVSQTKHINKLLAIERFLGIQPTFCNSSSDFHFSSLKFCPDCSLLLDKFAELYGALRRIELELEWRLGMMRDILVAASRVPSRVAFVRGYYYSEMGKEESVMMMSQVEEWRRKLVRNCELKLMGSTPKVKLCKLEEERDGGTGEIPAVPLNSDSDEATSSVTFRMNRRWASSSSPKKGLARPVQSSGPVVLQKLLKEEVDLGLDLGTKGDNDWMDKYNENVKDPFVEISNEFPQNPSSIKQEFVDESEEDCVGGETSANICESVVVVAPKSPPPPGHPGAKGLKNIVNGRRYYRCPICKFTFTRPHSLHAHHRTHHHLENPDQKNASVFRCNNDDEEEDDGKCAAFFLLHSQLRRHQDHAHPPPKPVSLGVNSWTRRQRGRQQFGWNHRLQSSNRVQYYQCRVCKATFSSPFNLRRHYQVQHGVRCKDTLRCDVLGCSAYFRTLNQLVLHKNRAHQKASWMMTGRVGGQLSRGEDLQKNVKVSWKRHLRQKHGKGRLPCTLCGKDFSTPNNLRQHRYNMHRNELDFKFPCKVAGCKRKFETEGQLRRHNNILHNFRRESYYTVHNRKEPEPDHLSFASEEEEVGGGCTLKFETATDRYRKDGNVQQGGSKSRARRRRRVCCEICGRSSFRDRGALRSHLKSHFGPDSWEFQCSVCSKNCLTKYQLTRHQRTHTGERPYVCQYCGLAFSRTDTLKSHKTSMHAP